MPYHLEGRLLEVCTCGANCPCQPSGQPDGSDCDAVNAWHIDRGAIDGTFMIKEIFPAVDTKDPGFGDTVPDQHYLLDGGSDGEYVWMVRMEYFMHHTPTPAWLLNRVDESYSSVKDKIEPLGALVSTKLLYDTMLKDG